MNFDEYQKLASQTASPKDKKDEFYHLVLGLVGEAGEIAEKVKKLIRDHDGDLSKLDKEDLKKELGDVLWYTSSTADFFDLSLDEIAHKNIDKLASRQARGIISGSGDNR